MKYFTRKIDFVIGSLRAGGAERVVSVLANYFAGKGHEVRIITFTDGDEYDLHPSITRIRFHKKALFNSAPLRGFFSLMKFYSKKRNRPDVISSHIGMTGYATIFPSKVYNIKLIISEHFNHYYQEVTPLKWILWNLLYRFPNAITVLTKFDTSFFNKKNKNVLVMQNPCSFTPIENLHSKRDKVILAVGNLNRYDHKGFDNLLEISSVVLNDHPDWKLKVIGSGEEGLKFLKKEANKYGIQENVVFTGYRNDVKELMAQSEIFILSSRREGLPMVLIEAMSQGMACIAYDCKTGPSDVITDNVNGILVTDQNKDEMITKLNELISSKDLRESLRGNTLKSLEKFSISEVGKKWEDLFNSLV